MRTPIVLLFILVLLLAVLAMLAVPVFRASSEEAPPAAYQVSKPIPLGASIAGPIPTESVAIADVKRGRVYVARPEPADLLIFDVEVEAGAIGNFSLPFAAGYMAFSPDGERLYLAERVATGDRTGSFLVVNPTTLEAMTTFTYVCPETAVVCGIVGLAVGPSHRLYVLPKDSPFIDILDGDTGMLLSRFLYPEDRRPAALAIHDTTLYTADLLDDDAARQLRSFTIDGVQPAPRWQHELTVAVDELHVAPDGSFLIACAAASLGPVLQIATGSLHEQHRYTPGPTEYYRAAAISADGQIILLLGDASQPDLIRAYDARSHELRRVWPRPPDADVHSQIGLLALAGGGIAYLEAGQLRHVVTDLPAPPPVAYTYCAESGLDEFGNEVTGWPQADIQTTAYDYVDGTYRIEQRVPGYWTAVTRDDRFDRSRSVSVRTWLLTEQGTSGLLFGLNADWTDFYTLEVTPSKQGWAIQHYHNGQWEWLAKGVLLEIRKEGQPNVLELDTQSSATHTYLKVNGVIIYSLTDPLDGRLGLSAVSYGTGVDARFDDYRGLQHDCLLAAGGQGGAPAPGSYAPPRLRDPLADFAP